MNFLDLPVELWVIIFNYVDTKTKIIVYNSSEQIREYFASGCCHLRSVVLSRSTIATVKTLDENLFVNLGEHILALNLSGVKDLSVRTLKPHMDRFVNLKSIDITFTNIDLPDIGQVCPQTVKNIAINFFKRPNSYKDENTYIKCREIFKERQFEVIHFVISTVVVLASPPLKFLKGVPMIKDLKLTIIDKYEDFFNLKRPETSHSDPYEIETNFNKLTYIFGDCAKTHKLSIQLDGVSKLDFNQLEYMLIMHNFKEISIYVSPIFANMFTTCCNYFKVEVSTLLPQNFLLDGNIIFKAWNKATTKFDDAFYSKLLLELKDYFPTFVCMHNQTKTQIVKAPSNWYCIDCCKNFENKLNDLPNKVTLTDLCRHNGIVKRCRRPRRPISLSKECKTTHHLTFLRISNVPLREDFFTNLFTACPKLVTLDIYMEKIDLFPGFTESLSKVIHLAKLKNFMLTSEDVEYEIIFEILSHCVSLENVHICEYERAANHDKVNTDNIVLFIKKCVNLYSLFIEADMTWRGLARLMVPLRKAAQTLKRVHLCVEVCESHFGFNRFVDVFNPSPLHILH